MTEGTLGQTAPDRRAVTVMFCDLVGSTAMSEVLDPEELLDVVSAFQLLCREVIERHDGHLAKYLGDGVLAFFGYPAAHDDDVQRSVRTALEVIEGTKRLNTAIGHERLLIQAKIGIHTGIVVAGMLEPGSDEFSVVGTTPNLAARLQDVADPDSIVVSADSQRLVDGYFRWRDLGEFRLKGIAQPVRAYRVLEESSIRTPFELAMQRGLRRLVGRDVELEELRGLYRIASDGVGQIVRLRGEGGIGKSRLLHAIREDADSLNGLWLTGRCMAESRNTAFFPVLELLRNLIGVDLADSRADQLDKLERSLADFEEPEAFRLLALFMSLEPKDELPSLMLSPELQRRRTMEALAALLVHNARKVPLAIIFEDLHWVDPSTSEFLEVLGNAIESERVLVLLSYRPMFSPTFSSAAPLTELSLTSLESTHVRDLVAEVAGGAQLHPDIVDQIVARADGVPLFVEELTRMVLESGDSAAFGRSESGSGSSTFSIPSTLESSLRTRLDRLGGAKAVLQLAAVIGREFDWMTLERFALFDDALLERSLDALVAAELVGQTGTRSEARYTFRHALIQDAAYQSLLKRTRREYHGRIAEMAVLGQLVALGEQPELVAHHFSEADMPEQAAKHWLLAGQRALDRSANEEAIAHFKRGLLEVEGLTDDPTRWSTELALFMGLGPALNAARGYGSAETEQAYMEALARCERLGDVPELFWVLWGLGAFRQVRAQHLEALEQAHQMTQLAKSRPELQAEGHFGVGSSLFYLGDIVGAREELEKGAEFFLSQIGHKEISPSGHHAGVMSLGYLAIALSHLGYRAEADRRADQGIELAREIGQPFIRIQSFHWACIASFMAGDRSRTQSFAEEEAKISIEYGFPFGQLGSGMTLAWIDATTTGNPEAVDQLRFGVDMQRGVGIRGSLTYFFAMLADACRCVGRPDEGLNAVAEGLAEVEATGEQPWEAELFRVRGQLIAEQDPTAAESDMRRALAIAHGQQARLLELRAAVSLTELLAGTERQAQILALVTDLDR